MNPYDQVAWTNSHPNNKNDDAFCTLYDVNTFVVEVTRPHLLTWDFVSQCDFPLGLSMYRSFGGHDRKMDHEVRYDVPNVVPLFEVCFVFF